MKKFLILDGNSLLHRAWHAIPPLTTIDGRVVNAAYGFAMTIEKMKEMFSPDYMAVAWDLPGGTFRHEKFEDYKGTREKKEDELYEQIDLIKEILEAYNIPSLSVEGMEADDILGTIAKKYGKEDTEVLVLTGDLDSLQLVDDQVKVVVFIKGLSVTKEYDAPAVEERYGLTPAQVIDLKALMGDSSDNIPGVAGVGKKTATTLLQQYGSIEGIYHAIERNEVPEKFAKKFVGQEEHVALMKELVTIVNDVDLGAFKKSDARVTDPNTNELVTLFKELEFTTLLKKYTGSEKQEKKIVTKKKTKRIETVTASALKTKELFIYLDVGQQDLFSSKAKKVVLFDGSAYAEVQVTTKEEATAILTVINSASLVVGHDLKHFMHTIGEITCPVFDTKVGSYLLSPGTRGFDFSTCVYDYLHEDVGTDAFSNVEILARLSKVLRNGLKEEEMETLWKEIEMPLIPVLFRMEHVGIMIDADKLKNLSKTFESALEVLTEKIHQLAGTEFNINSPSQLAEILFVNLKLSTNKIKKTKTGFSTAASELEKLWEEHAIVPLISEYRELAKLKSTYIDTLPALVAEDGRIHTTYNQTVAATGRLSSKDPNLQNIPVRSELGNEIRKAFIAPKGKTLVAIDYSQFELRLAAIFSKDESFIKAFNEGIDVHQRTAAEVLGIPEAEVTKEQRYAAKAINFGILYGMGSRNLAKSTGFSQKEAKKFLETYFNIHPGIAAWIEKTKADAHKNEYAETLFGRRRYLPDINGNIPMLVAAAERMAVNMPVQGTQADLIKIAMLRISDRAQELSGVTMLLQVHDELVFEIENKVLNEALEKLETIMSTVHTFPVPLVVDVELGTSWGALHDWKKEA